MGIDYSNMVATLADKAADVGNRDQALAHQKVLQARKDRIDGQIAAEITALNASGEVSSGKYKALLTESMALSSSLSEARAQAKSAEIKEERLELERLAPQGAEQAIAEADAQFSHKLISAMTLGSGSFSVPLPAIRQNKRTGEVDVAPVKASAPANTGETSFEASYRNAEQAQFKATATTDFRIPTVVVDLITDIVTYPRLVNKFRLYQTVGIENIAVNHITGINEAPVLSDSTPATIRGEGKSVTRNQVSTANVGFRALKVGGTATVTPELLETFPADMMQTEIADYLAQSLGLTFARQAVSGNGSANQAKGVVHWLDNEGTSQRVDGKGQTANAANIDRAEVTKLMAELGGEYQNTVGGLTLAANTTTFWQLWSNIQQDYPLFSDSRSYDGQRLGPWDVCVDDAFSNVGNNVTCIVAGNFMRAFGLRLGGALRLEVSRDARFDNDEIVIKAIQHFDTQPLETKALAGYRAKS